jgi:hypothetical protein
MVKRTLILVSVLLGILLYSGYGMALDAHYLVKNLPKTWEGDFKWRGSHDYQKVAITITGVSIGSDGKVVASGSGLYFADSIATTIDVKWVINPVGLRFEMFESNAAGSPDFVTNGSHVGHISSGLDRIEAVWTTEDTGEIGDLFLHERKAPMTVTDK